MPILEYHLVEGRYADDQIKRLLVESTRVYCKALNCPIDRVRIFVQFYQPQQVAVAGQLLSEGGVPAPYFHFLVLEGRPLEQVNELIAGFTDLCVEILGAERSFVRGGCWPIPPRCWGIGGVSASVLREREIAARAEAGLPS